MIVMKFGGTSVQDASAMREVAALARAAADRAPLIVLSATARTTDALFEAATRAEQGDLAGALELHAALLDRHRGIAQDLLPAGVPASLQAALDDLGRELDLLLRGVALLRELSPRSMDAIASLGERLSTRIFAAFAGAAWVDARTVLHTDAVFGCARPLPDLEARCAELLAPQLGPGRIVVTQGYIGATPQGLTTTLGRGGSDFSAALFGAALGAEDIQIWTDVEGVLTADPRIVTAAQPIAELGFAEAAELAAFGAKVLHPATIQPAVEKGIPVTVRHARRPQGRFTTITAEVRTGRPVTALAHRGPVSVLTVASARMLNQSGFLAKLFDVFARHKVSVDLISTAEVSVSLTVEGDAPLGPLVADLETFATVGIATGRAIVAVVGERLKHTAGITGLAFGALRDVNVEMISMGANEINLSIVVRQEDAKEAVKRLHGALIEGGLA
ncbi:lysine-sensitive aspartokinase 3 [Mesoterricola sediminis]|uniref:Aspartokinase n=1 Tax=Mesoterricola sediminis TaxID=2927980 RepID=A0AA48GMG2_9BACT|nr:lysine-sensitive aspartokinase 3 [Mesoterricola sediminis]BDU75791.1 aspartokinase [Mesoterricola sediminis]